jgi:hypothetical protein
MSIVIDKNGRRVYKTIGYLAYEDKERADKLDNFLKKKIQRIEAKMKQEGLLGLKGKSGIIKLWYNVGLELRKLWTEVRKAFELPDTFLTYFMKAVYDNSDLIRPGSGRAERLRNSHFYYCYLMAGFPWAMVEASGSWTEWVEFLDSKRMRDDPRIIEWFAERKIIALAEPRRLTRENWFRSITREIRNRLRDIDTRVLERDELFQKLDKTLAEVEAHTKEILR